MNFLFLLSRVSLAANEVPDAAGDFAKEHPWLDGLLGGMGEMGKAFGTVADELCKLSVDVSKSDIATAISGIGAGLVTFFMVLEIITYCFNVDFHAGFESAMKIGVKTVLMYIIVDNCMEGANVVIAVFKLKNEIKFSDSFSKVADPLKDMFNGITFSDDFFAKMIEPLLYGVILVFIFLALMVLFSMIIISLIGVVMETTILTAVAPVACATLVNSQVRQTGISALKNLAAISLQWSVISLSFTVYEKVAEKVNTMDFSVLNSGDTELLGKILAVLPPFLCMAALAAMISKSGEITRRALGA